MMIIIQSLLDGIIIFIICSLISMFVSYLAYLKGKMSHLIAENLKLLDKMHEGLIVVSESDRTLQFASKPAIRLLKQLSKEKE